MAHADRLTALLKGLTPTPTILVAGPLESALEADAALSGAMHLHLVLTGAVSVRCDRGTRRVDALAAVVTLTQQRHTVQALTPDTQLFSLRVDFCGPAAPMIFGGDGPPLCLDALAEFRDLKRIVDLIAQEVGERRCAQGIVLEHAADILLVGLLRHLVAVHALPSGVLAGLGDERLARTLIALHESPAQDWTLERMAQTAGMSRTLFANRFRTVMGVTPKRYLSQFRLMLARKAIEDRKGLKVAARLAGYASTAALSRALSRSKQLEILEQ